MPKSQWPPQPRVHKASGLWRVKWRRKCYYLGRADRDVDRRAYAELLGRLANDPEPPPRPRAAAPLHVAELAELWLAHARERHGGGREWKQSRQAMAPLVAARAAPEQGTLTQGGRHAYLSSIAATRPRLPPLHDVFRRIFARAGAIDATHLLPVRPSPSMARMTLRGGGCPTAAESPSPRVCPVGGCGNAMEKHGELNGRVANGTSADLSGLRRRVDQLEAELERIKQRVAGGPTPTPPLRQGRLPLPGYEMLVTFDQMAVIVHRKKRGLEPYRSRGDLPPPRVHGRNGQASLWNWPEVRPILERLFGIPLPEVYPGLGGD